MRKAIFETIETGENREKANRIYVILMTVCIVCSLIPLAFKEETQLLQLMDKVTVTVFIIDYILRLFTADFKYNQGIRCLSADISCIYQTRMNLKRSSNASCTLTVKQEQ